jgi:hypothetical protein
MVVRYLVHAYLPPCCYDAVSASTSKSEGSLFFSRIGTRLFSLDHESESSD